VEQAKRPDGVAVVPQLGAGLAVLDVVPLGVAQNLTISPLTERTSRRRPAGRAGPATVPVHAAITRAYSRWDSTLPWGPRRVSLGRPPRAVTVTTASLLRRA